MSDGVEVVTEQVGCVQVLEMHRPEVLNALNMRMIEALEGAIRDAGRDATVKCLVLRGSGRAFCAGDDLRGVGFPDRHNPSLHEELYHGHWRVVEELRGLEKPVVAALHGYALGGGCDYALAADLRVADSTLQLGKPYMARGMAGGVAPLAALLGLSVTTDLLLTGRFLGTDEAVARGLVHRVAPDGAASASAIELATEVAQGSPTALALTKRVLSEQWRRRVDDFLFADNYAALVAGHSPEQQEGVQAFLDKRRPEFD